MRTRTPTSPYDEWEDCWNCGGEGYSDHDCGEDCCVCLHPENNVPCDVCGGDGGWYVGSDEEAKNG